jgi:lysophospholipase L1-like esterase
MRESPLTALTVAIVAGLCAWVLGPPAPAATEASLVALGDSYSSGEGAPPFFRETATRANTCHRSRTAWPLLVASRTGRDGLSLACSGADASEVMESNPSRREPERRVSQIARLGLFTPDVVTVTVGGNDVGFAKILTRCIIRVQPCDRYYTQGGRDVLDDRIAELEGRLPEVYRQIQGAAPQARLVVIGYPRIFPRDPKTRNCAALNALTREELRYLNAKLRMLNAAIERAATRTATAYVSVTDAFEGHEIACEGRSWVHPLTFLSGSGLVSPYSFHPTTRGHRQLAVVIAQAL